MELLIPGLILVALMVWASTKIKKTAADAFEPELIETEDYSLQKPDGFLHVIGAEEHDFFAYSKEFGKGDDTGVRQATIEIDVFRGENVRVVLDSTTNSAESFDITIDTPELSEVNTEETANESAVNALYKIVAARDAVFRLRFAVLNEYKDDYHRRIVETFDSFTVKTH